MLTLQKYVGNVQENLSRVSRLPPLPRMANLQSRLKAGSGDWPSARAISAAQAAAVQRVSGARGFFVDFASKAARSAKWSKLSSGFWETLVRRAKICSLMSARISPTDARTG